ncbi:hypothetical protein R1flu_001927 [Riccia fluitans]|uniref:Uncharacterized protein n=1 Tax=Riccia fluitans TaxID=41844 RepID=A0ABD1Y803_9MARC
MARARSERGCVDQGGSWESGVSDPLLSQANHLGHGWREELRAGPSHSSSGSNVCRTAECRVGAAKLGPFVSLVTHIGCDPGGFDNTSLGGEGWGGSVELCALAGQLGTTQAMENRETIHSGSLITYDRGRQIDSSAQISSPGEQGRIKVQALVGSERSSRIKAQDTECPSPTKAPPLYVPKLPWVQFVKGLAGLRITTRPQVPSLRPAVACWMASIIGNLVDIGAVQRVSFCSLSFGFGLCGFAVPAEMRRTILTTMLAFLHPFDAIRVSCLLSRSASLEQGLVLFRHVVLLTLHTLGLLCPFCLYWASTLFPSRRSNFPFRHGGFPLAFMMSYCACQIGQPALRRPRLCLAFV